MMDFIDPWYIGAGVLFLIALAAVIAYEKGWLGGDARLVALIAKGEHELAALRAKLEARIAKRVAKAPPVATLEAVAAPAVPTVGDQLVSLLDAKTKGALTDEEYAAAKAAILKPTQ